MSDQPDFAQWPHVFRAGTGPVVLALHGTGGNETQMLQLAQQVAPGAAVLAPRGRVSENGAGRWFARAAEGVFDVDDVVFRAGELADFVAWGVAEYGLHGRPVIATGFSNGANMALALAMLHPAVTPSAVAFSGMYPFGSRPVPGDLGSTRLLLLNGADDPMAPASSVDTLERGALASGASVERITRSGGHGITDEELRSAADWVDRLGLS